MAEEFEAQVWAGNWWSSTRATIFNNSLYTGNYGGSWQSDSINMKTRSTDEPSDGCATHVSPDSAFHLTGSPPSTITNWNQALLVNERREEGYQETLPEILNLLAGGQNPLDLGMDQHTSNFITNSSDCTGNLVSTSYGYPSSFLESVFESRSPPQSQPPAAQPQQPLQDFQANLSEYNSVSSVPGFSTLVKPKSQVHGGLHLANDAPFWNSSTGGLNDHQAGSFASTQSRFPSSMYDERPNCPNLKSQNEEIWDLGSSMKKSSNESTFKRPRLETSSPLPTFKVRKEKLGDRVTALQQLVSPFGKSDTASVLHEAIEHIKILHAQVNVLSTPYMKNGATMQHQIHDKVKENTERGAKQHGLRSRGLCLVPVSSTFPVTTETATEYWTSSLGSTFR